MEQLSVKINQLVAKTSSKQKTFVRTFVTKPSNALHARMGKLFGMIEIESTSPKISSLIDIIIQEIKDNYYQSDFKPNLETATLTEQFEKSLKKTNIAIASFLESEQIHFNIDKVNIIIGLIYNQELHLAQVGTMGAILFYFNDNNYRIINIIEATKSPLNQPDPLKLFSQLISGKFKDKDIVLVTTANLLDYFSVDRLKTILTMKMLSESLSDLKQMIERLNSKENFGVLTIQLEKNLVLPETIVVEEISETKGNFKQSMKELIRTENDTEKFLTPSIIPEIKKYLFSFKDLIFDFINKFVVIFKSILPKNKPHNPLVTKINTFSPNINLNRITHIAQKIKAPAKPTYNIFRAIFNITRIKIKNFVNSPFFEPLKKINQHTFSQWLRKYQRLPKSSKILFVICAVLAILFSGSVVWLAIGNYNEKINTDFNKSIVEIESKKNSAESSLIYQDENQARAQLAEAKNILKGIQPKNNYQKNYLATLENNINSILEKLQHITKITEPIQIANFANLDNKIITANFGILLGRNYYILNLNNKGLYKANIDNRVMSYIPTTEKEDLSLAAKLNEKEIIFNNKSNKFFIYNSDDDSLKSSGLSMETDKNLKELTVFNNQVYALTQAGEIFRGKNNIFENWFKTQQPNLSDASSIFVDGQLYVLKSNGLINKFENGKELDLNTANIDPALINPTKIKTSGNYIYFIDAKTNRLIVLQKPDPKDKKNMANLVIQYSSDTFNDLKDYTVNDAEKKIYILNGSALYGIQADHLK